MARFDASKKKLLDLSEMPKLGDTEPGVTLKVLKKYSSIFHGKVPEVRDAII
jgi:hypothetical protein